jgi:hypothetical protein
MLSKANHLCIFPKVNTSIVLFAGDEKRKIRIQQPAGSGGTRRQGPEVAS